MRYFAALEFPTTRGAAAPWMTSSPSTSSTFSLRTSWTSGATRLSAPTAAKLKAKDRVLTEMEGRQ